MLKVRHFVYTRDSTGCALMTIMEKPKDVDKWKFCFIYGMEVSWFYRTNRPQVAKLLMKPIFFDFMCASIAPKAQKTF